MGEDLSAGEGGEGRTQSDYLHFQGATGK